MVTLDLPPLDLSAHDAGGAAAPATNTRAAAGNASADASARGTTQRKFRLGRDALDLSALDEESRADAEWLWMYCRDRDLDKTAIERLLRKPNGRACYSYDSVYQLLTGRRSESGANVEPICRAIAELRRKVDAQPVRDGFKETRLVKELWAYGRRAQTQAAVGFVVGNFAVGKSVAFEQLARTDPSVIYTRMPTRGHLNHFLQVLARKLAMGDRQTVADLRDRCIESFRPGMLLVVDEADQAFNSVHNVLGLATLDFLRELWDRARCGIVLIMDSEGRDQFSANGARHKKRLQRLWRRRLPILHLPPVPYREDLDLFAAGYGLGPAPDEPLKVRETFTDDLGEERTREHTDNPLRLQRAVLSDPNGGLFVWLGILAAARDLAREQRRAVTWGAVIKAHAAFVSAETGAGEEAE